MKNKYYLLSVAAATVVVRQLHKASNHSFGQGANVQSPYHGMEFVECIPG